MFKRFRRPRPLPPQIYQRETVHFPYQIRLSQRRSISLRIKGGNVVASAPLGCDLIEVERWVHSKIEWVNSQLAKHQQRQEQVPARQYRNGEPLPFMDETLTLALSTAGRAGVIRSGNTLHVTLSNRSRKSEPAQAQALIEQWYKEQAQAILSRKTHALASVLGKRVSTVQLRRTKSKWGHCTARGVIQYNWLILLAPEVIVDYLVAHECSHLVHLNHSASFWQLVQQHCPHALTHRRWLRQNGHTLTF